MLIDSYSGNSHLADQVVDLPSLQWQFSICTVRFLLWELISGRSGGRSTPQNGNFQFVLIDSYCENSYLADQVADLPPLQW